MLTHEDIGLAVDLSSTDVQYVQAQ